MYEIVRILPPFRTLQYIYIYIVKYFAEICWKIFEFMTYQVDSIEIKRFSAKSSQIRSEFYGFLRNLRKTKENA